MEFIFYTLTAVFFFITVMLFIRWRREIYRRKKEKNKQPIALKVKSLIYDYIYSESTFEKKLTANDGNEFSFQKELLYQAINTCNWGFEGEKRFLKSYIEKVLTTELQLSESEIDKYLDYRHEMSSPELKFRMLLYYYRKKYDKDAFGRLYDDMNWSAMIDKGEINAEMIDEAFDKMQAFKWKEDRNEEACDFSFNYSDKIKLLSEIVYESFGHGVIDTLRDQNIDGVSGGIGGFIKNSIETASDAENKKGNYSYDCIWIMFRGSTLRMKFLSFKNEAELIRVCKTLISYRSFGNLSNSNPKMIVDMQDGSRVAVMRPPFSESWGFFVRKFKTGSASFKSLFSMKGSDNVFLLLSLFVRAGINLAVTGGQGCGKTTLLKSLLGELPRNKNIRIEEMVFELWMRESYPERNIMSFRETKDVSLQDGIDFMKKTDAQVMIFGEIASNETAALLIELGQVSEQLMFTHHAMSTEKLVGYFRNALLRTGIFREEKLAAKQVIDTLRVDIHMATLKDGKRIIERISEIIPGSKAGEYEVKNLVEYKEGYLFVNKPSETLLEILMKRDMEKEVKSLWSMP
ncbi:MAG: Flp pilus assembly complex ATPase component TadA [Lachnospiraceae bacterium]|nr:Flp pilus assembly complex ATPase component TadA [Lachnospiraceae bacterium]